MAELHHSIRALMDRVEITNYHKGAMVESANLFQSMLNAALGACAPQVVLQPVEASPLQHNTAPATRSEHSEGG